MTPPPADELIPRLFLGPALRTQSDRRLVRLVRDGYEAAFEEIVRRYGTQLRRYASAIVGARAEDVTQDAFSKALQALRREEREVELRPWLYRIVRNTALNDLRDRPPATLALAEAMEGTRGVAEEVERREEIADLLTRLRALPEPQRAAIVMREMEGLGHDEIASALGISDGAARQTIHRARTALRNGLGMAIPLPLLRAMLEGGGTPTAEIAAGGAGAGVAFKAATATVLVAGTFGAGVALHQASHPQPARGGGSAARAPRRPHRRPTAVLSAALATTTGRPQAGAQPIHDSPRGDGTPASGSGGGGRSGGRRGGVSSGSGGPGRSPGEHSSSTGRGPSEDHHAGRFSSETSGHDGSGLHDGGATGGQSFESGDGGGSSGGGSGPGSNSGPDESSGSTDGPESNSGPGSGQESTPEVEESGKSPGDSGDLSGASGF